MEITLETVWEQLLTFATTYGIKVVGAILLLIAGRITAGVLRGSMRKLLTRKDVDPSLTGFLSSSVFFLVMAFTIIAALGKFGVEVASIVAVLGAAGFAIGFALQGSLSNFAAGVMILAFRPFRVGDFIDAAGVTGSVKEIAMFATTLSTPDNVKILVPNSKLFGDIIKNFSGYDTRRVEVVVGIGYGSSIDKAITVVEGLIREDKRILPEPEHFIAVTELADSSVNLVIRFWVERSDFWPVKFDMTKNIKLAFDAHDIEIPFPQRVVHTAGS